MKFTTIVAAVLAAAAVSVDALGPNADRLARGLAPLPPVRRATPTLGARHGKPSGIHNSCNAGPVQCCNSVTKATPGITKFIQGLLGVVVGADTAVGFGCHPLGILGIGGNSCNSQPVCCENNHFNGLVVIGCSPININA